MYCENPSQNHATGENIRNHSDENTKNSLHDQLTRAQRKAKKHQDLSSAARLSHFDTPCISLDLLARTLFCENPSSQNLVIFGIRLKSLSNQ